MPEKEMVVIGRKVTPSLVDLCVKTAIDNVRYLGDVGETDLDLLGQILPHCTVDQLMHVEKCSEGRDLSPVTDKLWKKFYEKQFGTRNTEKVVERMAKSLKSYKWIRLYEAKSEDIAEHEKKAAARIKNLYKKENARKQSRQVQLCTKVPPSKNKRSFYGGGGPGHNVSNHKGNLMKKSKIEFLNSHEVKNLAAMKKKEYQKNDGASPTMKQARFSGIYAATTSKLFKPVHRRT
ncbi:uncharacterized protein LOC121250217 isoform X1 [Juglans microcarpa x Juglans regia]|uniref:uncharacterized protein LOC121250217 isoform X1 n=2 Tax=Juglans microcarpa x Juglans regia TaxID=2249226 RepID=UPI001B7DFB92|nr:uncharacterized protein LOC121250217 isoform X1 [Juglans microcarpa x Juglans regia]XP_041005179.1 uncharacterized protein LOC121250217 isoform X1 [Juglans microcarpa x Juglans regia]